MPPQQQRGADLRRLRPQAATHAQGLQSDDAGVGQLVRARVRAGGAHGVDAAVAYAGLIRRLVLIFGSLL